MILYKKILKKSKSKQKNRLTIKSKLGFKEYSNFNHLKITKYKRLYTNEIFTKNHDRIQMKS